jgi:hypothetical protein
MEKVVSFLECLLRTTVSKVVTVTGSTNIKLKYPSHCPGTDLRLYQSNYQHVGPCRKTIIKLYLISCISSKIMIGNTDAFI